MSRILYYANQVDTPSTTRQVRTYQPAVRVGNWNEDLYLEEDIIKDFLYKKDNGLLNIQLSSNLTDSYDCLVDTTTSLDGYVHFGAHVMLKNYGVPAGEKLALGEIRRYDCVLALNAPAERLQEVTKVNWNCGVSGYLKCSPTPRNTFTIVPVEVGRSSDEILRFGQEFMLMSNAGDGLYLNVMARTKSCSAQFSRNHDVNLITNPSRSCIWQILHKDPRLRFEYEGIPVPANEVIILNNLTTNQCLAVEDQFSFRTGFGKEYEISAHTYLDHHKAEKPVNHWIIVMGTPPEKAPLVATFIEAKDVCNKQLEEQEQQQKAESDAVLESTLGPDSGQLLPISNSLKNNVINSDKERLGPLYVPPEIQSAPGTCLDISDQKIVHTTNQLKPESSTKRVRINAPTTEILTAETQADITNMFHSPSRGIHEKDNAAVMTEKIDPSTIPANPFPQ